MGDFMKQAVLIMVDTQRQDMLSCYDGDAARTPALDALARESMQFINGYTCQPVCGPARSAIFTGLYPHSNGMVANSMQLGANTKTAGEWLSPHGITCGYVGKWHLDGGDYFGYGKCPAGYHPSYWYDMRNFLEELSEEQRRKSRVPMACRDDDPREEDTYAHRCADRAIRFLEEFQEEDFFLTLSLDEPHEPSVCPRRFVEALKKQKFKFHRTPNVKYRVKNSPAHHQVWAKEHSGSSFTSLRKLLQKGMLACNLFCDYEIGRVLNKIQELGLEPLILYTADHGDLFLSHGMIGKGCAMFNEVTRVPFLIKGGGFAPGRNTTPVSHIDLLPTLMTYFGVKIPKMLQGAPLQNIGQNERRDIFMEFTRYEVDHDGFMGFQPIRCIFDGRYKLVINLLTEDELYDLQEDPYELENRILDRRYAKLRNELHERLIQWMNETRDVFRGYHWHCRPWRPDVKPSFRHTGYTRQLEEEDFTQLDYSTGLPMQGATRKK